MGCLCEGLLALLPEHYEFFSEAPEAKRGAAGAGFRDNLFMAVYVFFGNHQKNIFACVFGPPPINLFIYVCCDMCIHIFAPCE